MMVCSRFVCTLLSLQIRTCMESRISQSVSPFNCY